VALGLAVMVVTARTGRAASPPPADPDGAAGPDQAAGHAWLDQERRHSKNR
jgi:MFS transporter, DHA1 family, inner membrane transport protein